MLALVLGTLGAFYLQRHFDASSGVLAMPLPTAIERAAGTTARRPRPAAAGARRPSPLVDVPLQRHLHAQRLKMSHQEVKQEHKELEGNAEVKGKVRARMREMAKRRMIAAVPKADLVVMNPTHYAVALKYDEASDGRAARGRQGRRPAGDADPRRRARRAGAGAAGAGAGARAVRPRRDRPRDPGRPVRRRGAGAGLRLPAARRARGRGADAGRPAGARRAGGARPAPRRRSRPTTEELA